MKVRIKGNSIRLRLSTKDVLTFQQNHVLEDQTSFPGGTSLTYRLSTSLSCMFYEASFFENCIEIKIPYAEFRTLTDTAEEGINGNITIHSTDHLTVNIEKDLACIGRSEEANADTFPNNRTKC